MKRMSMTAAELWCGGLLAQGQVDRKQAARYNTANHALFTGALCAWANAAGQSALSL